MKVMRKTTAFILSFVIFLLLISLHLLTVDGDEVYTVSTQDNRFSYCENTDGTLKIKASSGTTFKGELTIPSTLDSKTVTAISERGFVGQTSLTKLNIPESVTSIEESAFSNCIALTNVVIKGKITKIGIYPFFETPFEKNLEKIGDFVILNDDILYDYVGNSSNIVIPNGVRVISEHLFTYFEAKRDFKIQYITFTDSVEYICTKAFYDCNNIINITIGTGIKDIGLNAFTSSEMTVTGYYDTYAQSYASDHGYVFIPIVAYGQIDPTIYVEYSKDFRQHYFSYETEFSREGILVFNRNYNGEKIEITDWEYSTTPQSIYNDKVG